MIFWHLGGAVFLFRLAFKDSDADLRFLAIGALLPDVIEWVVGWSVPAGGTVRFIGHSLAFCLGLLAAALVLTRRGSGDRKRAVVLAAGAILHLVLDVGWIDPQLLLWPMLGYELPTGLETDWSGLARLSTADLLPIGQEIVGVSYLAWLVRKARLGDPRHWARLWRSGTLRT
ncbi:metal-dependent hydrolase [Candidatus Spongiisocius sp.]|uniref:metal-dependent hydrolase n=1 Tax=Candidatus Spongiisocius sp. TaxID=3101273 RepID=UPI003B5BB071